MTSDSCFVHTAPLRSVRYCAIRTVTVKVRSQNHGILESGKYHITIKFSRRLSKLLIYRWRAYAFYTLGYLGYNASHVQHFLNSVDIFSYGKIKSTDGWIEWSVKRNFYHFMSDKLCIKCNSGILPAQTCIKHYD